MILTLQLRRATRRVREGAWKGALDPYRITDRLDDPLLDVMVSRLEARGNHWFFRKVLGEYLDAMDIDSAGAVLDMGCGTGVAARTVARRAGFSGRIHGDRLELLPGRGREAPGGRRESGSRVEFRSGDTRGLDVPDGSFDAVVAHILVGHVPEPLTVLGEASRVVKPGGLIAVFDGDYASMTFALDDPVRSKEYDDALINAVVKSPRVMRQMPRLIRQAGLEVVRTFPYVMVEVGTGDFWLSGIDSFEKLAPKSGALAEEEATS